MTEIGPISSEDTDRARVFWSDISGLPPEDLVFPGPPPAWRQALRDRLDRWPRGVRILVRLRMWSDAPPLMPLNLAPWSNARLPDVRDDVADARIDRLHDRLIWHLAHPDTRYEVLAWHRDRRRVSLTRWVRHKLRATLRGRPPGPPPWMEDP